jgi:hypothetical protein
MKIQLLLVKKSSTKLLIFMPFHHIHIGYSSSRDLTALQLLLVISMFLLCLTNLMIIPRSKITGRFRQENTGNHRKKSKKMPSGILLPCSIDFRSFLAESSNFLTSFRWYSLVSGGRNHRPRLVQQYDS